MAVADPERHRVVPGGDDPGDGPGDVAHPQPLAEEEGIERADPLVREVPGRVTGQNVELGGEGSDLDHRVLEDLAGLRLHRGDELVAVVDHPGPNPPEDPATPGEAELLPGRLRRPGPLHQRPDLIGAEVGHASELGAGGRVERDDRPGRRGAGGCPGRQCRRRPGTCADVIASPP